jgi:hypothetical protein
MSSASFGRLQLPAGSRLEIRGTWREGLRVLLELQSRDGTGAWLSLGESEGLLVGVTGAAETLMGDHIALRWLALDAEPIGDIRIDDIRVIRAPGASAGQ